jgi:hypothetical protein
MINNPGQNGSVGDTKARTSEIAVTPELVRQVTQKVYALWLRDLRIEKERQRTTAERWHRGF